MARGETTKELTDETLERPGVNLVKGYGLTNSGRYLLQGVGRFRLLSRPDQYFTLVTPPVRLLITNRNGCQPRQFAPLRNGAASQQGEPFRRRTNDGKE
jgi:hypothetical protein